MNSPKHVAIIMDGNGRWGIKKNKSRNFGHKKGLEVVETIISAAIEEKIKFFEGKIKKNVSILSNTDKKLISKIKSSLLGYVFK